MYKKRRGKFSLAPACPHTEDGSHPVTPLFTDTNEWYRCKLCNKRWKANIKTRTIRQYARSYV
jgi:hypothetical protein